MALKQLLLVRHAQPDEGHALQPGDPPLHPHGHVQARALALRRLAFEPIDRIVCSPQQRAIDTAAPLARLLGIEIEVIEGLAECDRHTARYRSPDTIRREEPHRWAEFLKSPPRFLGVDPDVFRQTVLDAFAALLADAHGRTIAVFSHGMPIKTMVAHCLGLARTDAFSLDHCSLTRLVGSSLQDLRARSLNESTP
ncbi:histidine phosphatase family protein [Variovorax sp. dw_954]|uniref:histidine phosphatase family protein n=1 Tax=Variovorax sp. dw_954 TaxID=2720078 RepID=UPI001BD52BB9|nr:histidine phosphatase family protein [Variovorax sp. dw_954]